MDCPHMGTLFSHEKELSHYHRLGEGSGHTTYHMALMGESTGPTWISGCLGLWGRGRGDEE
jgi:hypothetical protein